MDTLPSYTVVSKRFPVYTSSKHGAELAFILSSVFGQLETLTSLFNFLQALFWSPQTPEGNSRLLNLLAAALCSPASC